MVGSQHEVVGVTGVRTHMGYRILGNLCEMCEIPILYLSFGIFPNKPNALHVFKRHVPKESVQQRILSVGLLLIDHEKEFVGKSFVKRRILPLLFYYLPILYGRKGH